MTLAQSQRLIKTDGRLNADLPSFVFQWIALDVIFAADLPLQLRMGVQTYLL
jgi:hypothetical protein